MKENLRVLLDKSSFCGAFLHLVDEEYGEDLTFNDKKWHLPSLEFCQESYIASINNILEDLEVDGRSVIVACDPGKECKTRKRFVPGYKDKDRSAPPVFYKLRTEFFEWVNAYMKERGSIVATPKSDAEADDLINQLAIRLPKTVILTRDKDLLACPTDVIYVDKNGQELNPEKFPVPDKYIHLYRTLVLGDSSDNVGSCKGFGPKAWEAMIEHFEGEDVMFELDSYLQKESLKSELTPLLSEFPKFKLLIDQRQDLYNIYRTLEFMPVPAHQVKWEGGMLCGTSTLVTSGNFSSVLDSLKRAEFEYSTLDYETDTVQESKDWCVRSGVKVDVMGSEIVGAGVRVGNNNYYFCVDHADTDNVTLDQLEEVLRFISKKRVYVHNSIFEQTVTYNAFGWMLPDVYDTAIEASYVSENDSAGLKFLSGHWLDYKQTSYAETVGDKSGMRELTGEETLGYGASDVYVTDALQNLFETIMTYEKSWDAFVQVEVDSLYFVAQCFINGMDFDPEWHEKLVKENIEKKEESWATIQDYLFEIGWEGSEFKPLKGFNIATLKKVYLTKYGEPLKATSVKGACKELEDREIVSAFEEKDTDAVNKIYKQFWKPKAELNLRSPKQMKYLFYEALGLPVRIRNKPTEAMIKKGITQGSEATDEHAIKHALKFDEALGHNEFLKALVDYKGCLTKESLFFEKLPNFVHWKTGKIHASLRQCSTTTRRDSCSAPNNQQLSKKKDVRIRNMYKAKEGYTLVALDFSGQELRIAADDCQDENMLSCYIGDDLKDIHSLTGLRIANELGHGWTYEEFVNLIREEDFYEGGKKKVATPFRILAKFTNFGSNYGSLAPKLAQMMVITTEEAQKYLEARAETFPGLIKRAEDYKAECKKKKYSLTYLGGRRHLDGRVHFSSRDKFTLLAAERLAYSFRIQSSGSEILKIARGKVAKSEMVEKGHVLPATCIHDEQVVQVRTDMLDEIIPQLVDIMEAPYADMKVPMITEPEFGSHLGSLKPWVK